MIRDWNLSRGSDSESWINLKTLRRKGGRGRKEKEATAVSLMERGCLGLLDMGSCTAFPVQKSKRMGGALSNLLPGEGPFGTSRAEDLARTWGIGRTQSPVMKMLRDCGIASLRCTATTARVICHCVGDAVLTSKGCVIRGLH